MSFTKNIPCTSLLKRKKSDRGFSAGDVEHADWWKAKSRCFGNATALRPQPQTILIAPMWDWNANHFAGTLPRLVAGMRMQFGNCFSLHISWSYTRRTFLSWETISSDQKDTRVFLTIMAFYRLMNLHCFNHLDAWEKLRFHQHQSNLAALYFNLLSLYFPFTSLDFRFTLPLLTFDRQFTSLPRNIWQFTYFSYLCKQASKQATKLAIKLWCWQCSKSAKTIPKQNPELTRPHHHQTLCLLCQIRKTVCMLRQTYKIQPPQAPRTLLTATQPTAIVMKTKSPSLPNSLASQKALSELSSKLSIRSITHRTETSSIGIMRFLCLLYCQSLNCDISATSGNN